MELKLGSVDSEEKKYRLQQCLKFNSLKLELIRMDIAQLTTDIDRIKRMFSAILRYASRNKIHLPQVSFNATTHMGIKGCVLGTLDAGGLQGYFVKITYKLQSRSNSCCENFDLLNFHLYTKSNISDACV